MKKTYKYPDKRIQRLMFENDISIELWIYRTQKSKYPMTWEEAATTPPRVAGASRKYGDAVARAEAKGISRRTFYNRVHNGWSIEQAVNMPLQDYRLLSPEDEARAIEHGVEIELAKTRIHNGWDWDEALTTPVNNHWLYTEDAKEAKVNGIKGVTFYGRLNRGWTVEEAKTVPTGGSRRLTVEQNLIMLENELHYLTVENRIDRYGWSVEDAITIEYGAVEGFK
jgi:hypothetical protein